MKKFWLFTYCVVGLLWLYPGIVSCQYTVKDPYAPTCFWDSVQINRIITMNHDETLSQYPYEPKIIWKSSPSGDTLSITKDPGMMALQISGGITFKDIPNGFAVTSISGNNDTIAFHFNATTKGVKVYQGFLFVDGNYRVKDYTPAQITSNQNDYDISYYGSLRLNTDASRNVTGFNNGSDGRILYCSNVGAQNIVIQNQNAGSAAANRIITGTGADVTMATDVSWMLKYDNTTLRWRLIR